LAALFVVLNHIFERSWPGHAVGHAPWWASELIYGRFAVIMFIALSGFSLGLGPARSGWRFDSTAAFARRRAWRILPPYWAALGFSLLMTWHVLAQPGLPVPDGKSVLVYGLLVQDGVSVGSPNRAIAMVRPLVGWPWWGPHGLTSGRRSGRSGRRSTPGGGADLQALNRESIHVL
jgi:peptidoglycan/LPS O-acetylase OafA/YrhL